MLVGVASLVVMLLVLYWCWPVVPIVCRILLHMTSVFSRWSASRSIDSEVTAARNVFHVFKLVGRVNRTDNGKSRRTCGMRWPFASSRTSTRALISSAHTTCV